MDTTDFINDQIDQQEQQQFDEDKRMDEEDHGFDKPTDKLEEVNKAREKEDYVEMDAHDEAEMFNESTGFDGIRGYEPEPQNYE